jgi:lipid-A-disaccharide synthase
VCSSDLAEASGDHLAAAVIRGLGRAFGGLHLRGIAGEAMRAAAAQTELPFSVEGDTADLGAAGLVELIPALPELWRARRTLRRLLEERRGPALLVDAPDLHLPAARRAPRLTGCPIGLLVAPQYWAWRPRRAETLLHAVDFVLCLFRFEAHHLRRLGVMAHWVGHPAVDVAAARTDGPAPPRERPLVAILPGSRRSEVSRLLRPCVAGVRRALGDRPHEIVVPWRLKRPPPPIEGVRFSSDPGVAVLARANLAVVAAGTATLEAALAGVPCVVVGRSHPWTTAIARRALRIPWIGLPNILLDRSVVPELVQDLDPEHFVSPVRSCLVDGDAGAPKARALAEELLEHLGPPGFGARVAEALRPALVLR